jgi:hypothetical protein
MIKVFLATPTTGSVVDSQEHFLRDIREKYKDKVEFVYPKNLVRRIFHDFARNALTEDFLDSGADVMWFLDSDVTPPIHILDLITEHWEKWKLAGAVYPVFMIPPGYQNAQVVFTAYTQMDNGQYQPKAVIPEEGTDLVDGLATGCILIKREVLTEDLPERPFFKFTYDPNTCHMTEGEDFYFMRRANAKGLKFFTDYSMVCKHQKSVDLLDINNYAVQYAQSAVAAYDRALREQLAGKISRRPQAKNSIILPQWSR